eukprot:scaffold16271_cov30-Phaeocystis_antarctica.AAC.3
MLAHLVADVVHLLVHRRESLVHAAALAHLVGVGVGHRARDRVRLGSGLALAHLRVVDWAPSVVAFVVAVLVVAVLVVAVLVPFMVAATRSRVDTGPALVIK